VEKVDLSKGYQNPKRKLEVTAHFSEKIELKFGKKLSYILCILALFWNNGCLRRIPLNVRAISAKNIYQKTTHSTVTF